MYHRKEKEKEKEKEVTYMVNQYHLYEEKRIGKEKKSLVSSNGTKQEKKEMMTVDVEQEKGLFNQASYRHFCECMLCFFSLHHVVVHQIVTATSMLNVVSSSVFFFVSDR